MKVQFDSPPELSSDLEWCLQNGQASRVALADLLAREYYVDALRLSWAVLGDLEPARQTVLQAFTAALVNQYRFRLGLNARIWLFHFVIQAVRKMVRIQSDSGDLMAGKPRLPGSALDSFLQSLSGSDRLAFYVSILLGWQPNEAAELTGVEAARVEPWVDRFRQRAIQPLSGDQSSWGSLTLEQILMNRFPRQPLTEDEQSDIAARLVQAAEKKTTQAMRFVRLWETLLTAVGVVLVTGLMLWLNQTLPDASPPGAGSMPASRVIRVTRVVLVPVTAAAGDAAPLLTVYTVQPGDSLDSIAHLFGMAVADLMRLNHLSADAGLRVGDSLKVLTSPHIRQRGAQVATSLPTLPPPLNNNATPREVIQRLTISQSLWSTVWVDAQLTRNGPAGYIGPPDVTYEQAWIDNPGKRSIELSGKSLLHPDWVYTGNGRMGSQIDRQSFQGQDFLNNQLLKSEPLRAMLFPLNSDWFSYTENLVIAQVTPYIRREALQVAVMNAQGFLQAQLWTDVETGIILRELRYSGDRSQIQTAEFSITKISFDDRFTDELFNPRDRLVAGFSIDASGLASKLVDRLEPPENSSAHQPFPAGLPPSDFNPAHAQLYFRYPETFHTGDASTLVQVLAGGYSLGEAHFGNPWTSFCARSPDGQKIAFVSQPSDPQSGDATLHWFGLQNVNQDHLVSKVLAVRNFAFSYDSHNLAFFGRQAGQERGAVYIYGLQDGVIRRLLDRNSANSLVWSPDGNYLAMTTDPSAFGNQDAWVVNVHDGSIVAHDRYNWQGDFSMDPLSPDWPTLSWRNPKGTPVRFPAAMGGLETCVQPP
jgi:LysM repeat protein/DNA-directed RNA polymerase specialized sigma24 family protein